MISTDLLALESGPAPGQALHDGVAALYPICRSISGQGVRDSLAQLGRIVPLKLFEVPSGSAVLDWTVPPEWNIRDAWVKNMQGERVVDFQRCNLHVVNHSVPVRRRMQLSELRPHLFTLPEQPEWIPYRTTYYNADWGFCLSQRQLDALPDADYDICIDSTLAPGALTYGEAFVAGESSDEVLVSCHICHPSLANDNLSAMVVAAHLARRMAQRPRRLSYRFVFIPATIGAITWLARNTAVLPHIRHGLVLTCLGDAGAFTYKKSRRGSSTIDRAAQQVLGELGAHRVLDFAPHGYDERQYCSPGFDLPVGRLSRSPNGGYPEYHTSADDLSLVRPQALADSLAACLRIFFVLENDGRFLNLTPKGEPQLGRRGLYHAIGGQAEASAAELAMLWVLNLSDGTHGLLDIAQRSGLAFEAVARAAALLCEHGLLKALP